MIESEEDKSEEDKSEEDKTEEDKTEEDKLHNPHLYSPEHIHLHNTAVKVMQWKSDMHVLELDLRHRLRCRHIQFIGENLG